MDNAKQARGSNSVVEFLPSKQAVAGSSPVSRSSKYIVSLQADFTPVGNNQAVKRQASGRCFIAQKGAQRHPAFMSAQHPASSVLPVALAPNDKKERISHGLTTLTES